MAGPSFLARMVNAEALLLLRRMAVLVGSRFGGALLTLAYTLMIARLASPEAFGLAMLGLSYALLGSIPLSMNIESGSVRYLVAYATEGTPEKASGFLRFNFLVLVGGAGVIAALAALGLGTGFLDFATVEGRVALLAMLTAPVVAATRVYGRHASALDQVLRGSLPRMLIRPTLFCIVLLTVWGAGVPVDADLVMGIFLAAALVTALIQNWLLRATFQDMRNAAPDLTDWASWIKTGLSLAPLLLMRENLKNIIVVSAGFVLGRADVGLLALALSVLSLIIFAVKAVDMVVSPRLSKAVQSDQMRRAQTYLGGAAAVKLFGTCLGLGLVALLGPWLFGFFGSDYQAALGIMMILFAIPIADALFGPTDTVLNITGNRSSILIVSIWSMALLIACTGLGGLWFGLAGAAWGAGLAYAVQQAALCLSAVRQAGINPSLWSLSALLKRGQP